MHRYSSYNNQNSSVVSDETEHGLVTVFGSECAFIYSDNLVIINQVTPVTI